MTRLTFQPAVFVPDDEFGWLPARVLENDLNGIETVSVTLCCQLVGWLVCKT
jgi:hypothetical protein